MPISAAPLPFGVHRAVPFSNTVCRHSSVASASARNSLPLGGRPAHDLLLPRVLRAMLHHGHTLMLRSYCSHTAFDLPLFHSAQRT
mmetsp:Transcript_2733/g.5306  ORF Transcript_2733/g.5306 Transcript_2733/m.5306 type:complete len:86 (+) Transcript_2733:537-794(+)